jgi:hypothetical protein
MVKRFRDHARVGRVIAGLVAVQCILFRKSQAHNWAVQLHRDVVVPVDGDGPWTAAGVKEGYKSAKAPKAFLDRCVALRVHLDSSPEGDIDVVPGSHRDDAAYERDDAVGVIVPRGGGLLMRPLLAHASSKLKLAESRRVLHYLFAPPRLPADYRWYYAV